MMAPHQKDREGGALLIEAERALAAANARADALYSQGLSMALKADEQERELVTQRAELEVARAAIITLKKANDILFKTSQEEVAAVKEWNAQRSGQFACTEQRLATRIAMFSDYLEQMLNVAENADETGYVQDCGFVDLDKLHANVRAAIDAAKSPEVKP